jgi:hypothetical protein
MDNKMINRGPAAGGFFIFLGLLLGVPIGLYVGEPSLGMVCGFTAGAVAAVMLWLYDRARLNRK